MRNIIHPRTIAFLLIILWISGCKKDSNPPTPGTNHKPQTCYVSSETIKDSYGGGTKTTTLAFSYDENHELTKLVQKEDGPRTQTILYSKQTNQYREDVYISLTGADIGNHAQYIILYLNADQRADSLTQYNCVDCDLAEPTTFSRAYVIKYKYSGSQLIGEETHVPGEVGVQSHSEYEYDSKGRADYSVSFDEYDDTSSYEKLTYAANDTDNFKAVQNVNIFKYIYGDAFNTQPQSLIIYTSSNGVPMQIDWKNSGNEDGYLLSSTGTIAGNAYQTMTFTYDCFDK